GGSQGAHHLNQATVAALELLALAPGALRLTHQTGEADRVAVSDAYRRLGLDARVEAFVEDMGSAYAAADLVIARAGAMSCAEITAGGVPAVFVADPFAAGDPPRRHGGVPGAGRHRLILDRELNGPRLAEVLRPLLDDPATREEMAARSRAFGRPQAAAHVASVCAEVLERRST